MSAVLVAVFNDHATAERVRTDLVTDGFPTDRVQLTSRGEPGQAGLVPAASLAKKLLQHFRAIFPEEPEFAQRLADAICQGRAALTVQPRGGIETSRALELLRDARPIEVREHNLDDQALEHAAAAVDTPPVVPNIIPGAKNR